MGIIFSNPDSLYNIFVLIVILSSSFFDVLIPCRLQAVVKNNIIVRHIFCYFTMVIFVVLSDDPNELKMFHHIFLRSLVLYFWFLMLIKSNQSIFMLVLILLMIQYIIIIKRKDYIDPKKREELIKSHRISDYRLEKDVKDMNKVIYFLNFVCISAILLGVGYNLLHKYNKHERNFNLLYFVFGVFDQCKIKTK